MKRKTRNIVVREMRFEYVIGKDDLSPEESIRVRIWTLESSGGQKLEFRFRFDDPWLNFPEIGAGESDINRKSDYDRIPVTPSMVRAMIEASLDQGWTPDCPKPLLRFDWSKQDSAATPPATSTNGEQTGAVRPLSRS